MNQKTYRLLLILVFLLALLLRFFDFSSRLTISADDARDIMAAQGAIQHGTWPLIGSFASAGPFVFGPLFYWFLITAYHLAPRVLVMPYVAIVLVDMGLVYLMVRVGKLIGEKKLALIVGLFSAISTSQLARSGALTQHTFISVATALTILFFLLSLKKKKDLFVFLMGIGMGIGINMHYQAINLLVYGLVLFLMHKFKVIKLIKSGLVLLAGLVIPNLALLYWDGVYQNWANITNLLDYFLIGQYRFWVSNRWLTYATDFWPNLWANTIGGNYAVGIAFIVGIAVLVIYSLLKKKLQKEVFWLGVVFTIQVVLNRYYRGERFEGYLLYFLPLILVFSAWFVWSLLKLNKWLGMAFLMVVVGLTLARDRDLIKRQHGYIDQIKQIKSSLINQYPGRKFAVYDLHHWSPGLSQPLSLYFYFDDLTGYNDIYFGVTKGVKEYDGQPPVLEVEFSGEEFDIFELNRYAVLGEEWKNVNQDYTYQDMHYWWKERPFTSTFSIVDFAKERVGLK